MKRTLDPGGTCHNGAQCLHFGDDNFRLVLRKIRVKMRLRQPGYHPTTTKQYSNIRWTDRSISLVLAAAAQRASISPSL